MSFLDTLKYQFKMGGMHLRLVYINVIIFIALGIIAVFGQLMKDTSLSNTLIDYLGLNTNVQQILYRPYTILTYMFTHLDFWHLLSNMLMLFFIGRMLESYLGPKKIISIYVVGAIIGGAIQVAAKHIFPVFENLQDYPIIGASAGVMAIAAALVTYAPTLDVMLFGVIRVKIIWIVALFLIQDFFQMHNVNSGVAHFAHLGGALFGFVYCSYYKKGTDYLKWFDNMLAFFTHFKIDRINPFKKKKMKVSYSKFRDNNSKPPKDDLQYNVLKKERQAQLDAILDKIKYKGYEGLSASEKEFLANFK